MILKMGQSIWDAKDESFMHLLCLGFLVLWLCGSNCVLGWDKMKEKKRKLDTGSRGEMSLHGTRIDSITAASCMLWVGIRKEIIKLAYFGQIRGCSTWWSKQHKTQTNFHPYIWLPTWSSKLPCCLDIYISLSKPVIAQVRKREFFLAQSECMFCMIILRYRLDCLDW